MRYDNMSPTDCGAKHLHGLTRAVDERFGAYVLFVIQMSPVKYLHSNDDTDPAFGIARRDAAAAGVQILAMDCAVTPDTMAIRSPVPVVLRYWVSDSHSDKIPQYP